jgi:hypothetical protein
MLRLGSYGDPAAVWRPLLAAAKGWTGYTHARGRLARFDWLMASCETKAQAEALRSKGARRFESFQTSPKSTARRKYFARLARKRDAKRLARPADYAQGRPKALRASLSSRTARAARMRYA